MVIALKPENRESVHPLFAGYPCLRGAVASIMHGGLGEVFVTDPVAPKAALAVMEFAYLAGDPESESAPILIKALRTGDIVIAPSEVWRHLFLRCCSGKFKTYRREAFLAGEFDVKRLRYFCQRLPEEFVLKSIERREVSQFGELNHSLVYDNDDPAHFIAQWFGFGVMHQGRFVCGASAATIGGGKVEFEVQTHADYRRLGLATAASAAMILHCLELGLEPCWDAANLMSAGLARKLGFRSTGKYEAYVLV